jgi:hypothetical protein
MKFQRYCKQENQKVTYNYFLTNVRIFIETCKGVFSWEESVSSCNNV